MKSLTLRAIALFALLTLAHNLKPFTGANLFTFASASIRSMTELLPESMIRKTAVMAQVINRAWQGNGTNFPAMRNNLLAKQEVPTFSRKAKPRHRNLVARAMTAPMKTTETVKTIEEPVISWQFDATESSPKPAVENLTLPELATPTQLLAAPTWKQMPKRDSCEIPPTDESTVTPMIEIIVPETKSGSELETISPTPSMRPGRSLRPIELEPFEIQTIGAPRTSVKPIRLIYPTVASKSTTKC